MRRLKTYSAQTGYVYQYFYEGHRSRRGRGAAGGTEFVFRASADRKSWSPVSVSITDEVIQSWEQAHARALSPTEQYAVAKMALFQAFDERPSPGLLIKEIRVRSADLDAILNTLGIASDQ